MAVTPKPSSLLDALLRLLFPTRCVGCGRRGADLCDACRPAVPWLTAEVCPICASPNRLGRICRACQEHVLALDGARAACRFEGLARTAVHDLKFRRVRGRAALLGDLIVEAIERRPLAVDLLVPIPLGAARRRQRGFNQSELIALQVGKRIGVPVLGACLERVRETRPQVGLTRDERRENMTGIFRCREPSLVAGRRVALVDDVMTTGSTLDAGAQALKAGGAVRVYGLVFAREI